ncbi:hypothetical protein AB0L42_43295 [Streptomyces sp. NPDC052287]|uniref:hypothetical protein n=1 Tax=Streptomyces sp. NPDC052287 TaxID=3154950 RepID=UPI003423B4DE
MNPPAPLPTGNSDRAFQATAVTDAFDGRLADDATVLCLDWHGPHYDGHHAHTRACR